MKDHFALMGIPRRPVVDDVVVKEAYYRLAAEWHPDAARGETEKFRQLQDAYQTLKEPVSRLRHLAELEFGVGGDPARPPRHTDLFMRVGGVLQERLAFQKRWESARSSLAKAVLHQEKLALWGRILAAKTEVEVAKDEELLALEALDARWPEITTEEMRLLASGLKFLSRWQAELAEAEFGLRP